MEIDYYTFLFVNMNMFLSVVSEKNNAAAKTTTATTTYTRIHARSYNQQEIQHSNEN